MKYRKKPVEIDAFQTFEDNLGDLERWVRGFGDDFEKHFNFIDQGCDGASLSVNTLEGTSYEVTPFDWIVRGVKGEYYPCKPDIFEITYESAENGSKGAQISTISPNGVQDKGIMDYSAENKGNGK